MVWLLLQQPFERQFREKHTEESFELRALGAGVVSIVAKEIVVGHRPNQKHC